MTTIFIVKYEAGCNDRSVGSVILLCCCSHSPLPPSRVRLAALPSAPLRKDMPFWAPLYRTCCARLPGAPSAGHAGHACRGSSITWTPLVVPGLVVNVHVAHLPTELPPYRCTLDSVRGGDKLSACLVSPSVRRPSARIAQGDPLPGRLGIQPISPMFQTSPSPTLSHKVWNRSPSSVAVSCQGGT